MKNHMSEMFEEYLSLQNHSMFLKLEVYHQNCMFLIRVLIGDMHYNIKIMIIYVCV